MVLFVLGMIGSVSELTSHNTVIVLISVINLISYLFGILALLQGKRSYFMGAEIMLIINVIFCCLGIIYSIFLMIIGSGMLVTLIGEEDPSIGEEDFMAALGGAAIVAGALMILYFETYLILDFVGIHGIRRAIAIMDHFKTQRIVGV